MKITYYRFTLRAFGKDIPGQWREFNLTEILDDCKVFAQNGTMFTLEFRKE